MVDQLQTGTGWHEVQETIERMRVLADEVQRAIFSRDGAQLDTLVARQEALVAQLDDQMATWKRDRQPTGLLADYQIVDSAVSLQRTNLVNALLVRASLDLIDDFLTGLRRLVDEGSLFDCHA